MRKVAALIIIASILFSLLGCSLGYEKTVTDQANSDEIIRESGIEGTGETVNTSESMATIENDLYLVEYLWRKIYFGMTYEEVCKILGGPGERGAKHYFEIEDEVSTSYRWYIGEEKNEYRYVGVVFNTVDDQLIVTRYIVSSLPTIDSKTQEDYSLEYGEICTQDRLSIAEEKARDLRIGCGGLTVHTLLGEPTRKAGSGMSSWVYKYDDGSYITIQYQGQVWRYMVTSPLFQQ